MHLQNFAILPKISALTLHSPHPWKPPFHRLSLWTWSLRVLRISSHTVKSYGFCDWFISLSTVSSGFIRVGAWVRISFLVGLNNIPLCEWTILCLSIHPSVDTYVPSPACLRTWPHTCLFIFLLSVLLGVFPEVGFLDQTVILFFNLLRSHILHLLVNTCQFLVLFCFGFFTIAILLGVTWPQISRHLFPLELFCDNKPWGLAQWPRTVLCMEWKPPVDRLPLFPRRERV